MGFGWTEILLTFGIILLIFGPKRLPELARNLGSSINVFKEELNKTTDNLQENVPSDPMENQAAGIDSDRTTVSSETNFQVSDTTES